MSSKSSKIFSSVSSSLLTKDSLGPSSSRIDDRVFASLVMLKIAPTSSIPCELAAVPVGFQDTVGVARLGPVVMVFG